MSENLICFSEKAKIKKAFFGGKLKEFINKIQAENDVKEKDIEELGEYLKTLKNDDEKFVDKLQKTFGGKIVEEKNLPSVEELGGELKEISSEWKEKQEKALLWIDNISEIVKTGTKIDWGDLSIKLILMQTTLDKIRVYADQQYHARIIDIIDNHGTSRKEAEDRSRLTPQYRDYKNAVLLRDRIEQLIINTRHNEQHKNFK